MAYVKVFRTYRYIDKNPIIDQLRTVVQDEGLMERLGIVADLAGLSSTTPRGWFHGDIRDPRHSSIMAVLTSLGYEQTLTRARKLNIEKELEFARAWNKREKAKREKATPKKRSYTKQSQKKRKKAA